MATALIAGSASRLLAIWAQKLAPTLERNFVVVVRRLTVSRMEKSLPTSHQKLCQFCSKINIGQLSRNGGYEHHATLKAWVSSAATCRLCGVLLVATMQNPMPAFSVANDNDINEKLKDEKFLQSHGIALRLLKGESDRTCDQVSVDLTSRFDPTKLPVRLSGVFVFTNQDDPAAASGLPWRRKLPRNTGCEPSLIMAESWLETCLQGHSDYNYFKASQSNAPWSYTARRLIEVSSTTVRVVDGNSVKEPFATLSYCWGPGDHWPWGPKLIAKTCLDSELKIGLSREDLPKTIRDAVLVAERLKLRYLWIDAMCIQQNNVEDWLHESKNMASIYAEAQLNIAASGSPTKEAGLFNKYSESQHYLYNDCVQIDSIVQDKSSTLYFWHPAPDDKDKGPDAFRDQIDRGRLADRAWVCQERIASPRTLHFGETQLFWQCNHSLETEDNLGTRFPSLEDAKPWRSIFQPGGADERAGFYDNDEDGLAIQEVHSLWYCFIVPKHYSSRKLTEPSDKLVAISGLANKLKSCRKSMRYLAGLWSGLVLEGLLWSPQGPGRRFDEYVAPSWSWASRDGGVEYGDFGAANAPFECELLDCRVQTEAGEEFGRVTDAVLEIEASYLCGTARSGESMYGSTANRTLHLDNGEITGRALLDNDCDDHEHVRALLLRKDFVLTVFLLVIDQPNELGQYVRVGIGSVRSFEFADSFDKLRRSRWVIV